MCPLAWKTPYLSLLILLPYKYAPYSHNMEHFDINSIRGNSYPTSRKWGWVVAVPAPSSCLLFLWASHKHLAVHRFSSILPILYLLSQVS